MAEWTEERFASVGGGIELCYQLLGDPDDPPMILVAGVGSQMIGWPDGFCESLRERGFLVIRFDNRDCGRSTSLDALGTPSLEEAWSGRVDDPPYLLSDMAADAAGLLGELGHQAAHVVGVSLGGFIAQTLAIERPQRVLSLASVMSSTGSGGVGQPTPAAIEALTSPPPPDRDAYVESIVAIRRVIGSPEFEQDEGWIRDVAGRAFDRGVHADGAQRQLVASIRSGNRTDALGSIGCPTVVLHGEADPLIDKSGGEATAEAIPGAELVLIEGWGHDLPQAVWEPVSKAIAANAARTEEVGA